MLTGQCSGASLDDRRRFDQYVCMWMTAHERKTHSGI